MIWGGERPEKIVDLKLYDVTDIFGEHNHEVDTRRVRGTKFFEVR
jgi:hypothetical protein